MEDAKKYTIIHLAHGSEEWIAWRKTKITATDSPVIMGVSPYKNISDLWAEKLDMKETDVVTPYMQRGMDLEEKARDLFNNLYDMWMIPRMVESIEHPWMGASLDGMDITEDDILEIKCNGKKNHALALIDKIPEYHRIQIQHQLAVTGLPMANYFSFDGEKGVVIKVLRDENIIDTLIKKGLEFYHCLQNFIPPNNF
jgi:putative phage-type endonuclease